SEVINGASGGSIPSTHEPDLIPTSKEVVRYTVNETEFDNEQRVFFRHGYHHFFLVQERPNASGHFLCMRYVYGKAR
ncbi:MAG: hypothetical protein ACRD8W_32785, partial [Nitrososphaeraceae archaeon]